MKERGKESKSERQLGWTLKMKVGKSGESPSQNSTFATKPCSGRNWNSRLAATLFTMSCHHENKIPRRKTCP